MVYNMHLENNEGCWDLIDDSGNLHYPIDRYDLTDLFKECVEAIRAFKPLLDKLDTSKLTKPEQILLYNLLKLDL